MYTEIMTVALSSRLKIPFSVL